jgi:F-type H+-transporting ATPase subunit epsilon
MAISLGTFRFTLQTPEAKLLSCRAGSIIIPTDDGQMGVLRNHMPMLGKLGLGVMQVCDIMYERGRPGEDEFFLINGGFFRIGENNMTVLAYDIDTFRGKDQQQIEEELSEARRLVKDFGYASQHSREEIERASILLQLGRTIGISEY